MTYEDEQDAHLRRLAGCGPAVSAPWSLPERPPAPAGTAHVWYRGWEVGYDADADFWSGDGWIAYKGGCDLDAPEVRAATYDGCLDAVNDEEG